MGMGIHFLHVQVEHAIQDCGDILYRNNDQSTAKKWNT